MSTTIRDFGRHSERFGDIAFYYAFPIKFWFGKSMIKPDDVHTWCVNNCTGFYKVVGYTHESSVREADGTVSEKIIYVDKIYLASEEDAALIKLTFDVRDQKVKRDDKLARKESSKTKLKREAREANKIAKKMTDDLGQHLSDTLLEEGLSQTSNVTVFDEMANVPDSVIAATEHTVTISQNALARIMADMIATDDRQLSLF